MSHCFKEKLALYNFKEILSFSNTRHLPSKVNKSEPIQPHNSKAKQNGKHNITTIHLY